jgi:hypothetical protein
VDCAKLHDSGSKQLAVGVVIAATLRQIETRFLATMPEESPIDLRAHAHAVASVVIESRKHKVAITRERVTTVREHSENMSRLVRMLRARMRDRALALDGAASTTRH